MTATGNSEKTSDPGSLYHVSQYTHWSVSFQLSNRPSRNVTAYEGSKHQSD